MNKNNYCVIMAGGVGSRFWPLSRTSKPKQFLDILGIGKTLLQQTFERFKTLIPTENFYIVTNKDYYGYVKEQLPELKENQILLEPMRRNTAPCISYANYKIKKHNPKANIIVAPSDHLILKENDFLKVVSAGLDFVEKNSSLLTIGIKPSRIETGYGYIQVESGNSVNGNKSVKKVKTFTEKPDYNLAKVFFESGEFFWNSGIFFWSLPSISFAFEKFLPEIDTLFRNIEGSMDTEKEEGFIDAVYTQCKNISIDYGVMEKADNVHIICADFGWSDLGTWGSLYEQLAKDQQNNSIQGNNVLSYDNSNCIINVPKDKLAVIQGLDGYIVVESDDILLVCKKSDEQKIKQYVNDVKFKNPNAL